MIYQTIESWQNSLLQQDFFIKTVSLRILSSFVFDLHCLLCIIQNLSCTTSHISMKLFPVGFFLELFLEGRMPSCKIFRSEVSGSNVQEVRSYLSWTYQISSHSYMNENIFDLKYRDSIIPTAVFEKMDTFC